MSDVPQHDTVFDSDQQQVALLYGKALLGAARSIGKVDQVVDEFKDFVVQCLDRFPKLELALGSPRISLEDKQRMLDRIAGGKLSKTLLNFLKILCRRDRVQHVRAIQHAVEEMRDAELGRMRVQVRSATPLTEAQRTAIGTQLQQKFGKQAVLVEKVEPELLGGIVLRIGDEVFDGSIQGKLQAMRRSVSAGIGRALRDKGAALVST